VAKEFFKTTKHTTPMSASQFPPLQSKPSTKHCTNCSSKMALYSLPGHYDSTVDIDVCMACNAIWFDQFESMQLSPDGTVALFQLIHQSGASGSSASAKFSEGLRCVTCGDGMKLTNDQVKGTRFSYQACRKGHGRLTTFYNFLAEKQFVRELTKNERAKLAATVQQLRCSGCGAAVNIGKVDACEYCRAPVSVFDRDAAKKAIDHYLQARAKHQPPAQAPGERREGYRAADGRWNNVDRAELGADILYALGRAATRMGPSGARTVPAAAGGLSGGVFADTAGGALPDATSALFGGDALSGVTTGVADAAGAGIGKALALDPSVTLPSATDALFGGASEAAASVTEGLGGEITNVFSEAASSGIGEAAGSIGSSVLESVADGGADVVGEMASAAGEGAVDLVVDGIGSLLGALFS
jgi:hypothetical protein